MSRPAAVLISAAALLLSWQLFAPPVIGLANNGDFGKLLGYFSLGAPTQHEYWFADTAYSFDRAYAQRSGFYSSELILILTAFIVNAPLGKDGNFDLRLIGLVHGALFLLAFALFLPLLSHLPAWEQYALGFAALFLFGDVAYVSYLNSFYMDVAAYLFFLLPAVLYLRVLRWRRPADRVLLVICSVLLATSKPQHSALGFWIAFLFLAYGGQLWPGRPVAAALTAFALALTAAACLRYGAPPQYQAKGCYTMVFYQILPHARNPGQALADLGLDSSYRRDIGKTAYSDWTWMDDPATAAAFLRKVSYRRLAAYFCTHPRDAYKALGISLSQAGRHRPELGNFDSGSGARPWQESQAFSLSSRWKRALFHDRGTRFLAGFALLVLAVSAMLALSRRRLPRGVLAGGVVLIGMAATELMIASLGDALDVPRHYLLFYAQCDLLLLTLFYLMMQIAVKRPPAAR